MTPVSASASLLKQLPEIPSGSGIELIDGSMYIISDDSPDLFILDENLAGKPVSFNILKGLKGRIEKPKKPDFEAMVSVITNQGTKLYIFGSGGITPFRDTLSVIDITREPYKSESISLSTFYSAIIKKRNLSPGQLNIEAAAVHDKSLFLFNRGVNFIVKVNLDDFLGSLGNQTSPEFEIHECILPVINGTMTGFAGATSLNDQGDMLITATAENTTDYIQDGTIDGSYVGVISASEIKNGMKINLTPIHHPNNEVLKEKIESVAVRNVSDDKIEAYAVADNDNGKTNLFSLIIQLKGR